MNHSGADRRALASLMAYLHTWSPIHHTADARHPGIDLRQGAGDIHPGMARYTTTSGATLLVATVPSPSQRRRARRAMAQ